MAKGNSKEVFVNKLENGLIIGNNVLTSGAELVKEDMSPEQLEHAEKAVKIGWGEWKKVTVSASEATVTEEPVKIKKDVEKVRENVFVYNPLEEEPASIVEEVKAETPAPKKGKNKK